MRAWPVIVLLWLVGCAPYQQVPGTIVGPPMLTDDALTTADGKTLALDRWQPPAGTEPGAVLLALHGFNDYRRAFALPAPCLAGAGIVTYAYDQRGFGEDPEAGIWAGSRAMVDDVATAVALVRRRHPGLPVFLLGESMGAAVVLSALTRADVAAGVDGAVLVAPAVWGWSTLNFFYRATLWVTAHTARGWRLTGRGLNIVPTDNIDVLRAMSRDPLVIKAARVDAVYGLVSLMEEALDGAPTVAVPTLVLYGDRDEIIPRRPVDRLIASLPESNRTIIYPQGYHMLLRDLQGPVVWQDIAGFVATHTNGTTRPPTALPDSCFVN